jgi:uncharacterized membrane protein
MNQKKQTYLFVVSIIGVILIAALGIFFLLPRLQGGELEDDQETADLGYGSDAVKAEVVEILEEGTVQLGEQTQRYQVLQVELLEGEYQGIKTQVEYGKRQIRPEGLNLKPGDQIYVSVTLGPENTLNVFFLDFVRTRPLIWLLLTFIVFSVIISGWKGVRGLIGMAISFAVILGYIIPQILQGKDPVLISVSGAFFLLASSLYLIYGWTLKTHAAVLGTFFSLLLTAFLAHFFVNLTRLTGFGSEDALFLVQQSNVQINLQGLVLGGMLIGALGVLDDLVITQASVSFELHSSNPSMQFTELFKRSMRVGQDHVAATVNTLVLAYAGAALPMLLLFSLGGENLNYLLNLEYVTEEIVRTLVGSLGLIAAVPLTTLLSCLIALHDDKFGSIRPFLGPKTLDSDEDHHHHTHG